MAKDNLKGARLSHVLKPLKGKRVSFKHSVKDGKVEGEKVEEDAGFMLYLPNGHSQRLTKEQVAKSGLLNSEPMIINFDQVNDNKSAAGRFKFARTDAARKAAWRELENQLIHLCDRSSGGSTLTIEELGDVAAAA